jgi:hypothetical protein
MLKSNSRRSIVNVAFHGMDRLETRQLLASISGTVWEDLNTSRTLDAGEGGMSGWTVFIDANRNRRMDSGEARTVTDSVGGYRFDNLPSGVYYLGIILQDGYGQTFPSFSGSQSSSFNIDLNFEDSVSSGIRSVFELAAQKWESVIIGDLPDAEDDRGYVDDIALDITLTPIDGPGGVLGQAGPTGLRPDSSLPFRGEMRFDTADSNPASSTFYDTVLHEMAHALGFVQTIWENLGLVTGVPPGRGFASNPRFIGVQATEEYNRIFRVSESSVPLEPGTRFDGSGISHWRESVFGDELMSPDAGTTTEPLSRITAAAFADMGYEVDLFAADDYAPGSRPSGVTGSGNAPRRLVLQTSTYVGQLAAQNSSTLEPFLHTVRINGSDRSDVNFGVRLNSKPRVGAVLVSPNPQAIGRHLTIEAASVSDADGDPIHAVVFYRESNGLAGLQTSGSNPDAYIGTKEKKSQGKWVITAPTDLLSVGGVTYYARAIDDLGAAATKAGEGAIVAPQTIPTKPTGLEASPLSSSRVLLNWLDKSSDESGFVVQRTTDPKFKTGITEYRVGANVTSLLLTNQAPATAFYYRVRAFNTAGNSAFSGRATARTFSTGEAVVDNRQASLRGSWTSNTLANDVFFGPDYATFVTGRAGDRATFTPYIDFAGDYFIYIRWVVNEGNAASVPIDINTPSGTRTFTVDQTTRGGGWVLLGKFNLPVGDGSSVRINAGKSSGGTVIADAVRFLPSFIPQSGQAALPARRASTALAGGASSGLFSEDTLADGLILS